MKDVNDFGFSAVTEEELRKYEKQLEDEVKLAKYDTERKLNDLYLLFLPLLNNLKKDPEKHYIYWPNRAEKIDDFIKKIEKFVSDNS